MELIQRRHTCETTLGNAARRLGVTTSITCTHFTLDIYPSFSGTSVLCIIQPMPMLADHRICRRYRATRVTMPLQGNLQWPSTLVCRITQFDQVNLERSNTLSLSLPPRGTVQQFRDHVGTFNSLGRTPFNLNIRHEACYSLYDVMGTTAFWNGVLFLLSGVFLAGFGGLQDKHCIGHRISFVIFFSGQTGGRVHNE
jgi:hypothetical protein